MTKMLYLPEGLLFEDGVRCPRQLEAADDIVQQLIVVFISKV
jgi:hypothetical protein